MTIVHCVVRNHAMPSTLDSSSGFTETPVVRKLYQTRSASGTIKKPAESPLPGIRTPYPSIHNRFRLEVSRSRRGESLLHPVFAPRLRFSKASCHLDLC